MGNQLVGVAPSQIYPVEHYLSDHVDLSFDQSLGSTRFLKVARARSREGLVVVKVFAIHDPSLPLAEHKERILKVKEQLASAFNCLPYQRVILTDKAGLVMREYCKYSVYDRMSTRPFLTTLEKKWITFQVLYALHRMHKLGICHGDIKLENIMVTSWLWVLLTDIASFKPTFLPDDNPADFSYFFDTSRRRLCYVAPERFVSAPDPYRLPGEGDRASSLLLSESQCKVGELLPSMDIFSAGCALLELWNDGTPALDLPALLQFRTSGARVPSMRVSDSAEPALANLLQSMTEREPAARHSAEIYLDEARGTLFPEYFYSFLQSYMLIFSAQPIMPPDEKILRIYQDIKNIIKIFTDPSKNKNYQDLVEESVEKEKPSVDSIDTLMKDGFKVLNLKIEHVPEEVEVKTPEIKEMSPDCEGLILITGLVTSCIRGLRHCTSKLYALEILQLLCENSNSETILDRILPYIIHLTQEPISRVRARALSVLAAGLRHVSRAPAPDTHVFPEYVLPEIAPRATDPATIVRIAYANNIASLAETAVRFLDQTQSGLGKDAAAVNYETELATLHEMVRSTVSSLLTDSQASVKRALVENGITKLCVFFGKQKANDVILSHMVTFLNDKESAALRGCFFDYVVGVAAFVGHQAAPILTPLLQQGLTDQSEWIIARAVRATASLASLGLLSKPTLCSLLNETVPYLAHPNNAIRHEVCGLVSCVASLLNPIDVNCKVLPLVWPHLKHKLIQVEYGWLVLEQLQAGVPRAVLDAVLRHRDVDRLLAALRDRHHARLKAKEGTIPQYSEMGPQLKNLFRRLASDGMTEHVENQLLAMSAHLIKIQRSSTQHITDTPGKLSLKNVNNISKSIPLDVAATDSTLGHDKLYTSLNNRRTHKTSLSQESQMNTEWQHMFGQSQDTHSMKSETASTVVPPARGRGAPPAPAPTPAPTASPPYIHYSMAPCRVELRTLATRMQQKYVNSIRSQEVSVGSWGSPLPPPSWQPGNQLLAYLHEHRSRVNRLVTLPSNVNMFASCSDDGTVRLWDAAKMDGHAYVNRSKCVYNRGAGPVIALSACEGGHSLVGATQEGSIFVLRADAGGSRLTLSQCRQCGGGADAGVLDVQCTVSQPALVLYATPQNALVGWDLRAPGNAFTLQGSVKAGVYTCLQWNEQGHVVAGTSGGALALWDLRFHLPVSTTYHPNGERIRRVVHGGGGAGAGAAAGGARVWAAATRDAAATCLETSQRTHALLHHNSHIYVSALYVCTEAGSGEETVVAGGAGGRVRVWRPAQAARCRLLLPARPDLPHPPPFAYRSRIIDGTTVVQEYLKQPQESAAPSPEENIYKTIEDRSSYHSAPITDITMVHGNKCYLVTSSADGVINMWK